MSSPNCPHSAPTYHFGRGGSDAEHQRHQADIAVLLDQHQEIYRQVTLSETGFTAITTSENPLVAEKLQTHITDMKARFAQGRAIRSWDPVYALMFAYRDDIEVRYEFLPTGVKSEVSTQHPELVELLHAHAHAVSGFAREGREISGTAYPISEALQKQLNHLTQS